MCIFHITSAPFLPPIIKHFPFTSQELLYHLLIAYDCTHQLALTVFEILKVKLNNDLCRLGTYLHF